MKKRYYIIGLLLLGIFVIPACIDDNIEPEKTTGKLKIEFIHHNKGQDIVFDSLAYTNEAGNKYLVNEIQYFISDVTLHKANGSSLLLDSWEDIHYVDTDAEETINYTFKDEIIEDEYNSISFTFGINKDKNQSLMFVNPPESFMFWPENLGGGYHYMKLNGKWINNLEQQAPFNFHLGIGQVYHSFPDSISEFVQNYFDVKLEDGTITISKDKTTTIHLVMNVDNWFNTPNTYDHNFWGGDIMQKQDAMKQAVENGQNVFSYISK